LRCIRSALVVVAISLVSTHAVAATYDLPLHAFGVTDSTIAITVDDATLVPSLSTAKLTAENVEFILPYRGSPESLAIKETVLQQGGLSLGSTALYFYLAVNLAFDRIYRNLILFDRDISKEIAGVTVDGKRFANFRRLAQLKPIANAALKIEVYADRSKFDQRAAEIGLHTPRAFWDPDKGTIGLYFDNRIFRWVNSQSTIIGQSEPEIAIHIRDYVTRRVIDTISHEIVHFIQDRSQTYVARNPFFAELVAVFLEENIYLREERSLIALAHTSRRIPLKPWLEPCAKLWSGIPAWSVPTLRRLPPGMRDVDAAKISMEKSINLDEREFYAQDADVLASEYVLFNPFAAFLTGMDKDEFEKRFSALIDQGRAADTRGLDNAFRTFVKEMRESIVERRGHAAFEQIRDSVTYCLNSRDFIAAHSGSLEMVDMAPDNTLGVIYMGDVFFNSNNAFFALDYYDMAYRMLRPDSPAGERAQVVSRLADAFELLGDAELAASRFREIEAIEPDSVSFEMTVILRRSRLKLALYNYALQRNKKADEIPPLLVEMYVHALQGMQCGSKEDKASMQLTMQELVAGDQQAARATLRGQFERVQKEMLQELAEPDWDGVLSRRRSQCP